LPLGFAALLALAIAPIQALANPDFLVDADWLADGLDEENLIVLEVR
jgi:thiosulfate/3-mercaptopyruvate sulfurtransferase